MKINTKEKRRKSLNNSMKPIPAAALTVSLLALVAFVTLHQPDSKK